jgi:hypothetical protein
MDTLLLDLPLLRNITWERPSALNFKALCCSILDLKTALVREEACTHLTKI